MDKEIKKSTKFFGDKILSINIQMILNFLADDAFMKELLEHEKLFLKRMAQGTIAYMRETDRWDDSLENEYELWKE